MIKVFLLILLLTSCAGITPDMGNQEVVVDKVEQLTQTSDNRVVNNFLDYKVLGIIVLLAGWAIPSPGSMLKGILSFLSGALTILRGKR